MGGLGKNRGNALLGGKWKRIRKETKPRGKLEPRGTELSSGELY